MWGRSGEWLRRTMAEAMRNLMARATWMRPTVRGRDRVHRSARIRRGIDQTTAAGDAPFALGRPFPSRGISGAATCRRAGKDPSRADVGPPPAALAKMITHFSDITINRLVRTANLWDGCYLRLLANGPPGPAGATATSCRRRAGGLGSRRAPEGLCLSWLDGYRASG